MKITFNILNQKYGSNLAFSALINMLSDVPHEDITPKRFFAGFVVWELEESQVMEVFSYAGVDYWDTIKSVVLLSQSAHAKEVLTNGQSVSNIVLPVNVKAKSTVLAQQLPVNWPDSIIDRSDDAENPDLQQMTLDEWFEGKVTASSYEEGYVTFPILKNSTHPTMEVLVALFDFKEDNPALEIELMNHIQLNEYVAPFEQSPI